MSSREIRTSRGPCQGDPFGIPACFYWTIDEVADWIESIGYGKYKENFRSHFINGRRLLAVDACFLPKMGIVHFGDILALASCIKNILGKGPTVGNLHSRQGPRTHYHQQLTSSDLEYFCGWKCWFPDYNYGYVPKSKPITMQDFEARWRFVNCGFKTGTKSLSPCKD